MGVDAELRRLPEALRSIRPVASRPVETKSPALSGDFQARGLDLSDGVRRVFTWRDDNPWVGGWSVVLPGYDWLDSDQALEQYGVCLGLNERMATLLTPEEAATVRWNPAWLPLFADGAGDYDGSSQLRV